MASGLSTSIPGFVSKQEEIAWSWRDDAKAMKKETREKWMREIRRDMAKQMVKKDPEDCIPFWGSDLGGKNQGLMQERIEMALSRNNMLTSSGIRFKSVLNTLGGSQLATIRTDLLPHIWNLYLEKYPAMELFPRNPANGLSHSWVVSTDPDFADAAFVDDMGTVTQGAASYTDMSTLVAISMAERGATFRAAVAQRQSGMNYDGKDAYQMETERGMSALLKLHNKQFYQGYNLTSSSSPQYGVGNGTDEYGTWNQFGYNGLRAILGNVGTHFGGYFPGALNNTPQIVEQGAGTFVDSVNTAVQLSADIGGEPDCLHISTRLARKLARETMPEIRKDQDTANGMTVGANVTAITTILGDIPIYVIRGDSIGQYTAPSGSVYYGQGNVEDAYLLQSNTVEWAYLGAPMPFVIEIPMGYDGQLTSRFLIAWLASPCFHAPVFNAKIRVIV